MTVRTRYLVTTLALLAVAGGYAVTQGRQHAAPVRAPRTESASRPPAPRPAPTAREILDRREELKLTDAQRVRLEALDREWSRESSSLQSAVDAASQEFSRFMEGAGQSGRVSLGELQQRSDDVRQLGASLRNRRQLHADAAARTLTDEQRRELHDRMASLKNPGGMR